MGTVRMRHGNCAAPTNLLEIVLALCPTGGLPSLLHGREQKRHQNRDNGNDNEEFDEREPPSLHKIPRFQLIHLHDSL